MSEAVKVLVTDYVWPDLEPERAIFDPLGIELVEAPDGSEETLTELARDADGILTCFALVTPKVLSQAPRMKVVARYGVGVDNIAVDAATDLGIAVTYVPDYCVDEVSDHVMAMLLAFNRRVIVFDQSVRNDGWGSLELNLPMTRLRGLTFGVVGYGRIGRAAARKAMAFGMRILVADPFVDDASVAAEGCQLVDLDTLLAESDFITLHAPLTEQTRGMIGAPQFERMKESAFLINCARGPLIDEPALIDALSAGSLAGAGLDVVESNHPPADHPPVWDGRGNRVPARCLLFAGVDQGAAAPGNRIRGRCAGRTHARERLQPPGARQHESAPYGPLTIRVSAPSRSRRLCLSTGP